MWYVCGLSGVAIGEAFVVAVERTFRTKMYVTVTAEMLPWEGPVMEEKHRRRLSSVHPIHQRISLQECVLGRCTAHAAGEEQKDTV